MDYADTDYDDLDPDILIYHLHPREWEKWEKLMGTEWVQRNCVLTPRLPNHVAPMGYIKRGQFNA